MTKAHQYPMAIDEVKTVVTDFATIQEAIDWFAGRIIVGDCRVDVDAGAYDEQVQFRGLVVAPGATLTLRGDTRILAGVAWVDGAPINRSSLANGGSGTGAIVNAGAVITVTGTVTNPDFDADGWGVGDRLLVYDNAGNITLYDIAATLNNAITLTVAAPAIGNDGTAIALVPNRSIELSAVGHCVEVLGTVKNVVLDGWFLTTAFAGTGTENGVEVTNGGGSITCQNTLTYVEDTGYRAGNAYASIFADDGAVSAFGGSRGASAASTAQFKGDYFVSVRASQYGIFAYAFSFVNALGAIVSRATTHGYRAEQESNMYADISCNRSCGLGYYARNNAYMSCDGANVYNTVPGVGNYSPAPGAIPGYGNGNGDAELYAA